MKEETSINNFCIDDLFDKLNHPKRKKEKPKEDSTKLMTDVSASIDNPLSEQDIDNSLETSPKFSGTITDLLEFVDNMPLMAMREAEKIAKVFKGKSDVPFDIQ